MVAQEVRALAARSANAVKEIEALIGDTLKKVGEGHAQSEATRVAMQSIISHMGDINQLVHEINQPHMNNPPGSTREPAMTHIGDATHINAGRVSQSEETARTLREKRGRI